MAERPDILEKLMKRPNESRVYTIDFTNLLGDDETLTGTPTVTDSAGELTLTSKQVNTVAFTENNETVAIGAGVQFRCAGGTTNGGTGTDGNYTITIQCATTDSNTLETDVTLQVRT